MHVCTCLCLCETLFLLNIHLTAQFCLFLTLGKNKGLAVTVLQPQCCGSICKRLNRQSIPNRTRINIFAEATPAKCFAHLVEYEVWCLFQQPQCSLSLTLKGFLGCLQGHHTQFAGKSLMASTFPETQIQGYLHSIPLKESNLTCCSGIYGSNSFSASGFWQQQVPYLQVLRTDENQRVPKSLPLENPHCRHFGGCSHAPRVSHYSVLLIGCS